MFPSSLSDATDTAPGQLLADLERRQDDVLKQLDELEAKLGAVLKGLNIEIDESELD